MANGNINTPWWETMDSGIEKEDENKSQSTNVSVSADDSAPWWETMDQDNSIQTQQSTSSQEITPDTKPKEITTSESIKNSLLNFGEQLGDVFEFYGFKDNEDGTAGANESVDIAWNALKSGIFGSSEESSEEILSSMKGYETEKDQSLRTKGILESLEKGDVGGAFAGAINALTNGLGSAVYGASTFGVGFLADYSAENYIEFNKLKAQNLGKSFDSLVKEGEADVAVPLGIAVAQSAMEAFALSKVMKVAGGKGGMNPLSSFGKELATKALYNKTARTSLSVLGTGSTEFITEISQHAAEQVNKELGRVAGTNEEANIKDTIIDAITSQEGLEAGIQGFIGGAGMAGGTYSAKAVQEARRVLSPGDIEEDMIIISLLENKLKDTKDETAKEGIRESLKQARVNFADKQRKVNEGYENLSDNEILEIEDRKELSDVAIAKITDLNKKLESGQITEEEHEVAKQGFMKKYEENRNRINDIIYSKDKAAAETMSEETGLSVQNTKTEEEYEDALVKDQSNGEFSNQKELDDYLLKKPRKNSSKKSSEKLERAKKLKNRVKSISRQSTAYFAGEGSIIISEDKSKKAGDVSVNSHEVLHPILNALVGNRKEQGKIVKQVKKAATWKQRRYVAQQMNERGISPENQDTEFLNILSDGIIKGDIDYEQGVFERIGKALGSVFSAKKVSTVGFDDGQQVYNFIKEYTKGSREGVVSDAALKAVKEAETKSQIKIKDVQGEGVEDGVIQPTQPKSKAIETNLTDKDLSEGETIVDSEKDKKGRNFTRIAKSSEKDGVKTTKFSFNRDDKPTNQRNSGGVSPEVALGDNYEVDSKDIPEGSQVSKVFEIREGETSVGATVEFTSEDGNFRGEVVLNKKTKGQESKQKITEEEILEEEEGVEATFDRLKKLGNFNKFSKVLKDTVVLTNAVRESGINADKLGDYDDKGAVKFVVNKEYKKFNADAVEQVYIWLKGNRLPTESQFNEFVKWINKTIPARQRGKSFEEYLSEVLKLVKNKVKGLVVSKPTEKGGVADVVATIAKKIFKVEAKMLKFQASSITIRKNFGEEVFEYGGKKGLSDKFTKKIKTALKGLKKEFDKFQKEAKDLTKDLYEKGELTFFDGIDNKGNPIYSPWTQETYNKWEKEYTSVNSKLPTLVFDQMVENGSLEKITTSFDTTEELIAELYARKGEVAPDYIEIAASGFFYLPKPGGLNEDPLKIKDKVGIKKLQGTVKARIRPVKNTVKKSVNNKKYPDQYVTLAYRLIPVFDEITSKYEVDPKTSLISETEPTISTVKGATQIVNSIQLNQISEKKIKEEKIKSSYQLSKTKKDKKDIQEGNPANLSNIFNDIIEDTKNIDSKKRYSAAAAKAKGGKIGKYKFFVPPSAEDFMGLIYSFLGKGELGNRQKDFFETFLNAPYKRGVAAIDSARQKIHESYKRIKKENGDVVKKLSKTITGSDFTYDQAIRVYIWKKAGVDLSKTELSSEEIDQLSKTVESNQGLMDFANQLESIPGLDNEYPSPGEFWQTENISSDLNSFVEKIGRKKFLKEFIENKEEIFSKENLNKIEAIYGSNFREALEDSLFRMENGTNRNFGKNRIVNQWSNWINNSVGAIMFLNMRSALLQTISSVNFLNWNDNNPLQAGLAFANQKQFWTDFVTLYESDKLKQRRSGLKIDINQAELVNAVSGSKNKAKSALNHLLKLGFTPTQIADSFAISIGGASMYRNRINTYEKQGMSTQEAEQAAFEDFSAITEETQQSSDPSLISQQQSGPMGRLILAFANTPMQYARLTKKAALDLIYKRGDFNTNLSKLIYYAAVQNIVFNGMQTALFAMMFDDDAEEEEIDKKEFAVFNGMLDSLLRGAGIGGAAVAALKNGAMKYYEQKDKKFGKDHASWIVQLLRVSPPLGSKVEKLYSAARLTDYEKDVIAAKGFSLDSPIYEIGGKTVSAFTNLPLDRAVIKLNNLAGILNEDAKTWQKIGLALGWDDWALGLENQEHELIKANAKDSKRKEKYRKSSNTRNKNRGEKRDLAKEQSEARKSRRRY